MVTTYGSATADGGVGPQPTNSIVVQGTPKVQHLLVETATTMYPGHLVQKGTADHQIIVGTAGADIIGVLGYEQCQKKDRPATRATIYTAVRAPVLSGPGTVLMLKLADGETVTKGEKLVPTAGGEVVAATAAAPPSGSVAVVSTSAQPTMAGSLATEGIPIAKAEESVTTSGAADWIMARMLI